MSGPITASYSLAPEVALAPWGAISLAVLALREARAMGQEYAEVLAELQRREAASLAAQRALREDRLVRLAALRDEVARRQARLERLRVLATGLVERAPELGEVLAEPLPPVPDEADESAWESCLRELGAAIERMEAGFAAAGAGFGEAYAEALPNRDAPSVADVLHLYAVQRNREARLAPAERGRFEADVARILARLELAPEEALPVELENLARRILQAADTIQAEALATELRRAVQGQREARAALRRDAAEAREWLDVLGEAAPEALRRSLERSAMAAAPLDPMTRELARRLRAELEEERRRMDRVAAAQVLEQSLEDLGYTLEPIDATLFIDGGVVHFQRHGWEGYFVRLRLDPRENTLNFNVVRARDASAGAERRRLDFLAEDRWCAEFPRLMETLKARGIHLDVTRMLGAGELPVQEVDPATLPARAADESRRAPPAAREMPR